MASGIWFHLKATQVKIRNFFFYNRFQKDLVAAKVRARCHDLCLLRSSRTDCFGTQIGAFSFDMKHLRHTKNINDIWTLFSPLVCAFCFLEDPEPFYPTVILLGPSHATLSYETWWAAESAPMGKLEVQRLTLPASLAARAWSLGGSVLLCVGRQWHWEHRGYEELDPAFGTGSGSWASRDSVAGHHYLQEPGFLFAFWPFHQVNGTHLARVQALYKCAYLGHRRSVTCL